MNIFNKKLVEIPLELADPILNQPCMVSEWVFLSKAWNQKFNAVTGKSSDI